MFQRNQHEMQMLKSNDIATMSAANDTEETNSVNEDTAYFRTAEEVKVFIMKSQKTYATVLFLLVGISIGLAIAGIQVTYKVNVYEKTKYDAVNRTIFFNNSNDEEVIADASKHIFIFSNIKLGLESALTVVSFATCISLYYYYRTVFLLKKVRHEYPKTILFINARPLFPKFLAEILLCVLHLPPLLSTYVNPKFQLLVFIRIYLIGRYLQQKHSLMHSQSTRCLARLGNTKLTSLFLVKASFRKYPFQMMVFGYTSFVLISTYVVWLLEETYSYFDTMWMLIIAMTTVGFGDLTPQTTLGRLAVTMTSLVGILFIAIFCFLASQALTLQRKEKRVLAYYEIKEKSLQKKKAALNCIGMWYKYYSYKRKHFPSYKHVHWDESSGVRHRKKDKGYSLKDLKLMHLKTKMYKGITYWRALRNDPEGTAYNQDFVLEDMKIMVHNMSNNIDELMEKPIDAIFPGITDDDNDDELEMSDVEDVEEGYFENNAPQMHHQQSSQSRQEIIPTVKVIPPRDMQCRQSRRDDMHMNTSPSSSQYQYQQVRNPSFSGNTRQKDRHCNSKFENPNSIKILEELLSDVPHGVYDCSQRDKNIMIAFNLMKIQHNLLNNAIETIYHKTKYDVSDIQRRVNSFMRQPPGNCTNVYETGL